MHGKGPGRVRALCGVARCITRQVMRRCNRVTETLMGRPVLQRESALIWMEDVAGYLLALADIIQKGQKDKGKTAADG